MPINSRYKLKTGEEVDYFPPIQNTDNPYLTEAAMHADQANQLEGYGYLVDGVGAFTYLGTLAGTAADYEGFGGVDSYGVVPVSASRNFLDSDIGKILLVTANITLTMPAGLSTKFRCEVDVKAAGLCTMVMASGVTWTGGAGLILDPEKMCTIYAEALNTYRIKGETKA